MAAFFCTNCGTSYTPGADWRDHAACNDVGTHMRATCVVDNLHEGMVNGCNGVINQTMQCYCSCHIPLPTDAEVAAAAKGLLALAHQLIERETP